MAHHGERSRWLLARLDMIAERREQRRRAQEAQRPGAAGSTERAPGGDDPPAGPETGHH